ncbi:MAG: ribosome assembly RNA-binding protein YhbY [Gammaproteobacteria bacterium]|nr:ribosome assembly RNA-binding protein YhbY [Gammaproteobacteria bacterium]MDH5694364.1 ribosome assembly RNA-binding protein YhbY [Gammaproteobacteria bacterium]
MSLSSSQIKYLRGLVHELKPVIIVGGKGVTEALIAETDNALEHHELIKVKISVGDKGERLQMAEEIANKTQSTLIHTIGRMAAFYRASEARKITLP